MPVDKLDRILNRNNVTRFSGVAMVNHGSQRGRLAAARCANKKRQSSPIQRNIFDDRHEIQFIERHDLCLNLPDDEADVFPLTEDVYSKATQIFIRECQVHLHVLCELLSLPLPHNRMGQRL